MRLMTVQEIAELCQVHKVTVYRWIKEGKLPPPKRIGRKMLWSYGTVIDAMDKEGNYRMDKEGNYMEGEKK